MDSLEVKEVVDGATARLDGELKAIREKYVPVSEERLNKLWGAMRGTIDEYTRRINTYEANLTIQNDKIATLTAQVANLNQAVAIVTAKSANVDELKRAVEQVLADRN